MRIFGNAKTLLFFGAVTTASGAATKCPTDNSVIGYSNWSTLKTDVGKSDGAKIFVLCPNTTFTNVGLIKIRQQHGGSIFKCGRNGSVKEDCVKSGGGVHFNIYEAKDIKFHGITFTKANWASIASYGPWHSGDEARVEFRDCLWKENEVTNKQALVGDESGSAAAINNWGGSIMTLNHCQFYDNRGPWGAVFSADYMLIVGTIFKRNIATYRQGGSAITQGNWFSDVSGSLNIAFSSIMDNESRGGPATVFLIRDVTATNSRSHHVCLRDNEVKPSKWVVEYPTHACPNSWYIEGWYTHDAYCSNMNTVDCNSQKGQAIGTLFENRLTSGGWVFGGAGGGNMFDVLAKTDLEVTGFMLNLEGTKKETVQVWTKEGTHVGHESTRNDWKLIGSGLVPAAGAGHATPLPHGSFDPIPISKGDTQAFYITATTGYPVSSVGTAVGDIAASNLDLNIMTGQKVRHPFGAKAVGGPMIWNGVIEYDSDTVHQRFIKDGPQSPTTPVTSGEEEKKEEKKGGYSAASSLYHSINLVVFAAIAISLCVLS